MTADEIFESQKPLTAEALFAKADTVKGPSYNTKVEGSMEHFISIVGPALILGSGCEAPPPRQDAYDMVMPYGQLCHYPNVVATFTDRGIVRCDSCDKQWEVPFTILDENDGETVSCGTPKEVLNAYITPDEVAANDDDGDEPEVVEE